MLTAKNPIFLLCVLWWSVHGLPEEDSALTRYRRRIIQDNFNVNKGQQLLPFESEEQNPTVGFTNIVVHSEGGEPQSTANVPSTVSEVSTAPENNPAAAFSHTAFQAFYPTSESASSEIVVGQPSYETKEGNKLSEQSGERSEQVRNDNTADFGRFPFSNRLNNNNNIDKEPSVKVYGSKYRRRKVVGRPKSEKISHGNGVSQPTDALQVLSNAQFFHHSSIEDTISPTQTSSQWKLLGPNVEISSSVENHSSSPEPESSQTESSPTTMASTRKYKKRRNPKKEAYTQVEQNFASDKLRDPQNGIQLSDKVRDYQPGFSEKELFDHNYVLGNSNKFDISNAITFDNTDRQSFPEGFDLGNSKNLQNINSDYFDSGEITRQNQYNIPVLPPFSLKPEGIPVKYNRDNNNPLFNSESSDFYYNNGHYLPPGAVVQQIEFESPETGVKKTVPAIVVPITVTREQFKTRPAGGVSVLRSNDINNFKTPQPFQEQKLRVGEGTSNFREPVYNFQQVQSIVKTLENYEEPTKIGRFKNEKNEYQLPNRNSYRLQEPEPFQYRPVIRAVVPGGNKYPKTLSYQTPFNKYNPNSDYSKKLSYLNKKFQQDFGSKHPYAQNLQNQSPQINQQYETREIIPSNNPSINNGIVNNNNGNVRNGSPASSYRVPETSGNVYNHRSRNARPHSFHSDAENNVQNVATDGTRQYASRVSSYPKQEFEYGSRASSYPKQEFEYALVEKQQPAESRNRLLQQASNNIRRMTSVFFGQSKPDTDVVRIPVSPDMLTGNTQIIVRAI